MHKIIIPVTILALVITTTGCQPTKTESSNIKLWPLLESNSTTTILDDGWAKTDKGDACLVAHWDHAQTFNGMGEKNLFNENLEVWPLFDCHSEKTNETKFDKGTILLFFNYDNSKER